MTKEALITLIGHLEVWALIFGALVVIGVAGETFFGVRIWWNNRKLQVIQDSENVALQFKVSQANDRALQAESHLNEAKSSSALAEQHAAEANERAEIARKDAEGFRLQIADASKRAAEAQKDAETERLARIKIEERLSGWRLEPKASERLSDKLRAYKGTPFDLSVNPVESNFMETLDSALHDARWIWQAPKSDNPVFNVLLDGKAKIWYGSGISVEISQSRTGDLGKAAFALVEYLIAEGIPAKGRIVLADPNPSAIHIAIGKRE